MICMPTDPDVCHVPVFLGGRGFLMYHVPRNERICEAIKVKVVAFWEDHVLADIPPTDSEPTLEVIEHLKRKPKTIVSIPLGVMERWTACKAAEGYVAREMKDARVQVLKALGDSDGGDAGDAGGVTYFEQSRAGFDLKRFKKDDPELAAKYVTESQYRVLRTQKPK
jgi:hypothetical protein